MTISAELDEYEDEYIEDDYDNGHVDSNYKYESTPRLVNHGGLCCGIKTIYGLGYSPDSPAKVLEAVPYNNRAKCGDHVWSSLRYFSDAAPAETYAERVERYIKFVQKHAPKHLIEVVLESGQYEGACSWNSSYPGWKAFLRKHKFKKVNSFLNSNSGNTVLVFHKTIGQPVKAKAKPDPFA